MERGVPPMGSHLPAVSHRPPVSHRIPELAWGAQGVYVCRASAPGGQAEDRATLTMQGRSSPHGLGDTGTPRPGPHEHGHPGTPHLSSHP